MEKHSESKVDRRCISSVLRNKTILPLSEQGITPDFFQGDYRRLYEYIQAHSARYGCVPDKSTIMSRFNWFVPCKTSESMDYYGHLLRERQIFVSVQDCMMEVQQNLSDGDALKALSAINSVRGNMVNTVLSPRDMPFGLRAKDQLASYAQRKEGDILGITTGFPLLDKMVMCFESSDFIVIGAPPRTGKTWIILKMAEQMLRSGEKVLFFTKEMKRDTIARRLMALIARVPYKGVRRGTLSAVEEFRFRLATKYAESVIADNLIIIGDDGHDDFVGDYDTTNTLDYVEAKIDQYKPGAVFIDGYYLMSAGAGHYKKSDYEQKAHLTKNGKRLCNKKGVPIIVTTQLTREGATSKTPGLTHLSFSYTFAFDADGVLLLTRNQRMSIDQELMMTIAKFREEEDCGNLLFHFHPATEIDAYEEVEDVEELLEDGEE